MHLGARHVFLRTCPTIDSHAGRSRTCEPAHWLLADATKLPFWGFGYDAILFTRLLMGLQKELDGTHFFFDELRGEDHFYDPTEAIVADESVPKVISWFRSRIYGAYALR